MANETKQPLSTVDIELVHTNLFIRWPCSVCGGHTGKNRVLAEGESEYGKICVCEFCLEAGNIDERLKKRCVHLICMHDYLCSLIGRMNVPSFDEWKEAVREAEKEWT